MTLDNIEQGALRTDGRQRKPWQPPVITDSDLASETQKGTTTPETLTPVFAPKTGS